MIKVYVVAIDQQLLDNMSKALIRMVVLDTWLKDDMRKDCMSKEANAFEADEEDTAEI